MRVHVHFASQSSGLLLMRSFSIHSHVQRVETTDLSDGGSLEVCRHAWHVREFTGYWVGW